MSKLTNVALTCALAAAACLLLGAAGASANVIYMPNVIKETQHDRASGTTITPPAPPCPQYSLGVSCTPVPETPALGVPYPGNMAYYGGHVQVTPKEYLVYWGWGQRGPWPACTSCTPRATTEASF